MSAAPNGETTEGEGAAARSKSMSRPLRIALVLAAVYVLWGSTAPAIKIAVAAIAPWWMAALRFGFAGTLLWTWSRVRGVALPTKREWRSAAITGTVLLVVGNGVFSWTLQYLPSGIGALFFALSPLFMSIFAFIVYRERLSRIAIAGIALGLGGMLYLYSPTGRQHLPTFPAILGASSAVVWAFGSILQRRLRGSDVVQMSAMQMLVACGVLLAMALLSGERLARADFTLRSTGALVYLIIFGSVLGFSAFLWLMNNVPTALGSTYSYVNPLVSLAIGIGFLHEPFSWPLAAGTAVIVGGVALMLLAPPPTAATGMRRSRGAERFSIER